VPLSFVQAIEHESLPSPFFRTDSAFPSFFPPVLAIRIRVRNSSERIPLILFLQQFSFFAQVSPSIPPLTSSTLCGIRFFSITFAGGACCHLFLVPALFGVSPQRQTSHFSSSVSKYRCVLLTLGNRANLVRDSSVFARKSR